MDRTPPAPRNTGASGEQATNFLLDRYELVKELGHGGMARVWHARERATGRELALKRLSADADRRHAALFEREYYTLTSLHHPNIVKVYDFAVDPAGPYYTMELLHGTDVSKLAPRPYTEVCEILRDIASALALLHARRFVHRDVSSRNVWRTSDSRTKLIDFGTLAPFGKCDEVAGTPPYIAPEALQSHDLDQRTDLFALGALGYWLLTGMHAYPARSLTTLPELWKHRPRSAAHRVAELKRADLPKVPEVLASLIDRMLAVDPRQRVHSTAEVLDPLSAIASLSPEQSAHVPQSYLNTPTLTGRTRELARLAQALRAASAGCGSGISMEGEARIGKTRTLAELAFQARMATGIVLQVEADRTLDSSHSLAEQLAHKLLDELPAAAHAAAQPHASTLAHLSSRLRERLNVSEHAVSELPRTQGEARMRVHAATSDWFLQLARDHLLVLLVDDFDASDPASAAWIISLVREARSCKLLIVVTLNTTVTSSAAHSQSLRRHMDALQLTSLDAHEIDAMLASIFGDAPHLPRLTDLVTLRAQGSPGLALDLVEHLVAQGLLQYSEGTWLIPSTIGSCELPSDAEGVLHARLGRLPAHARALAQVLSVREGLIPFELCTALAEGSTAETCDALELLVAEGVLAASVDAYRFEREPIRKMLYLELSGERKRRAHIISAELLLSGGQPCAFERLRGGLHLLLGGEVERGSEHVTLAAKHYALVDLADTGQAASTLERALTELRALGRPEQELVAVQVPLVLAGYFGERQYSDRYAETTIEALERLVGLQHAHRLQPPFGKKLGLLLSLGRGALRNHGWSRDSPVLSFRESMMLLFTSVAATAGVATVCMDPVRARRIANVLEPLRALGENHPATLIHDYCLTLACTSRDATDATRERWQRLIERFESARPIIGLSSEHRVLYLAAAMYASGVIESWRDSPKALELAQRLEDFGLKLFELSANQIRMLYYAHQGQHTRAEHYRERVEVHAIQRGTAWQAETWSYSAMIAVHVRTHNVLGLKHCAQQLQRLSQDIPSLEPTARRAQAAYLVERGSPQEALAFLNVDEEPLGLAGWARSQGVRARALNSLGLHAQSQVVCREALRVLSPADLEFVGMNLNVQIELALAEAGLKNFNEASAQLDRLLAKLSPLEGPLTMSALHEARAQVALLQNDHASANHELARLDYWVHRTSDRSLIAHAENLVQAVRSISSSSGDGASRDQEQTNDVTLLHRLRHGGDRTLAGTAAWILDQLIEYAEVQAGHVFWWRQQSLGCGASYGELPEPAEFTSWLHARLTSDDTVTVVEGESLASENERCMMGGRRYRMISLITSERMGCQLVGALILPDELTINIPTHLLRAMANRLATTFDSNLDSARSN